MSRDYKDKLNIYMYMYLHIHIKINSESRDNTQSHTLIQEKVTPQK